MTGLKMADDEVRHENQVKRMPNHSLVHEN
jgi:hypothetical protein